MSDILIVARNIKDFYLLAMRKACAKHKEKRQIVYQHCISSFNKLASEKSLLFLLWEEQENRATA